jgi:hypothetical protein
MARRLLPFVAVAAMLLSSAPPVAAAASTGFQHASAGNQGANVRALQYLLRSHGSMIGVTGVFDALTVEAVKAFQAGHALPVDGQVGTSTWTALVVRLERGATGDAVTGLARLLNEKRRASLPLTGIYDVAVARAVAAFQVHVHVAATGITGPATWRLLLAHLELPVFGATLCDYSSGNGPANWGTAAAVGQLEAAASVIVKAGHGRVGVGDISWEHGGDIRGHQSHEVGMDADLRPMRTDERQCTWGTRWTWTSYDRSATRALVKAIRAAAPGHIKVIYFNDPVLIREGLVTWHVAHDDHIHVRFCERIYPLAAYDC